MRPCAYCKKQGAKQKCNACLQRSYCDQKCQKKDWKTVHRDQCEKLQLSGGAAPAGGGAAASAAAAATAAGEMSARDAGDDDDEHPCPICLDNEDDATVNGKQFDVCSACGQMFCGACSLDMFENGPDATAHGPLTITTEVVSGKRVHLIAEVNSCPTCRAPLVVSDEKEFERMWKLVHDRSPGRHTPVAQFRLGTMLDCGEGVPQDHAKAAKWYRLAAEHGDANAQYNLSCLHATGSGVLQSCTESFKWLQAAGEQGHQHAQYNLGIAYTIGDGVKQDLVLAMKWYQKCAVQQQGTAAVTVAGTAFMQGPAKLQELLQKTNFPPPDPGTLVTTILLAARKYNNRCGKIMPPTVDIRPGRVAVLLDSADGVATLMSFKMMNLQLITHA